MQFNDPQTQQMILSLQSQLEMANSSAQAAQSMVYDNVKSICELRTDRITMDKLLNSSHQEIMRLTEEVTKLTEEVAKLTEEKTLLNADEPLSHSQAETDNEPCNINEIEEIKKMLEEDGA